ncbi:MAG: hypothetical protein ABIK23_03025 [candidate division WOR-3 bacterium]
MKPKLFWAPLWCLIFTFLPAQWLETMIDQADSLCVMDWPGTITFVPSTNSIYVSGDATIVIDAAREIKTAYLPISAWTSFYNPVNGLVYLGGDSIYVVNPVSNLVVTVIPIAVPYEQSQIFAFDSTRNRLYFIPKGLDTVYVVDCKQNTIASRFPSGNQPYALCYASAAEKVYSVNLGNCTITVIDAAGDSIIATIPGEWPTYHPLSYSPVNNRLYFTTSDDGMFVIDCSSDQVVDTIRGRYDLWRGWYNPRRNTIHVLDGEDWGIATIDCSTNSIIREFPVNADIFVNTCINPVSQKFYYIDTDYRIGIIDCLRDSFISCFLVGPIDWHAPLCVNPVANKVYCGNLDWGSMSIIDGVSNRLSGIVPLSNDFDPMSLCYIPGRDVVYCGNNIGVLSVIDCHTNQVIASKPAGLGPRAMVFVPSERKVFALNNSRKELQVFSSTNDSLLVEIQTATYMDEPLIYIPSGKIYCLYPYSNCDILSFDAVGDSIIAEINTGYKVNILKENPSRNELYAAQTSYPLVVVIDGQTNNITDTIPLPQPPIALALSRTLDRLFCLHNTNAISVVDCSLKQVVATVPAPTSSYSCSVIWNPISDKLYFPAGEDSLVIFSCTQNSVETMLNIRLASPLLCDTVANKVYVSCDTGIAIIDGATNLLLGIISTNRAGHQVACWSPVQRRVYTTGGERNSTIAVIRDAVGITEKHSKPDAHPTPTIIHNFLLLPSATSSDQSAPSVLLDITGRKVLDLKPGANDIRHLSPGVYFLMRKKGTATESKKILIVR